ncbi:UDP-Glycosyltransferase/glycogen phosphorylase [Microstroma glucosiphilum]|uniref:GDP-Man:Man(3)GlcNAc(2)-PP-Dol alpha-1,2-mannosyltransferase n=1 Tax=Pseudomicrostroma glucosiphilum TaxID=1684307 RepID=A0A316UF60_9BASI|nr:UDP-Glycosyltransferase/glycogen phosphorylase [Pseudomicrostroma glucosiphilum]PWN22533.1 UDP-Glycosyltransferase/glycogen phosphorylase [Pseudomicrostroma glucosiphilum]
MTTSTSPTPPSWAQRIFLTLCLLSLSLSLLCFRTITSYLRHTRKSNVKRRRALLSRLGLAVETRTERYTIIGFFHPYCNAGGGGERVLFEAMRYHLEEPKTICIVYTGDVTASHSLQTSRPRAVGERTSSIADGGGGMATQEEILRKAADRFAISLEAYKDRIAFLPLSSRRLVSDSYWSRLTLLGQSLGSVVLAKEACEELIPDVFIDTMGYAFTYPVMRAFNRTVPIGAYVHYPTISTDMLQRVKSRKAGHTNDAAVARSALRSQVKLWYYQCFAWLYSWALKRSDVIVANGTWTRDHINRLILNRGQLKDVQSAAASSSPSTSRRVDRQASIVYPPCDTSSLQDFPLQGRGNTIVSLAQFRPEKEHRTQLLILRGLLDRYPQYAKAEEHPVKLIMMGSCRNTGDEERIASLRSLSSELHLDPYVDFIINAPYPRILSELSTASIGLSTMVDEHFGINVVEFLAAGLLTLSHASAGPLLDIAVPDEEGLRTGFHAKDSEGFVERLAEMLQMREEERVEVRRRARLRALRTFSAEAFRGAWERELWLRLQQKIPVAPGANSVKKRN